MLGNYLAKLGEAEGGVGEFSAGETTLLEAYELLADGWGPEHERTIQCVQRLVRLYEARHATEPDAGYNAKAAQWRAKLEELEATSQPRTQVAE